MRHATLPDNINITKRSISASEKYLTICVEWAGDLFGLSLTQMDPLLKKIWAKNDFPVTLTFDL